MIRIFITAILYLISFFTQAQATSGENSQSSTDSTYNIKTVISKMNNDKGNVYFALYSSQEDFENRRFYKTRMAKSDVNGVAVVFENVPAGVYAITCFHDANDNQRMDFGPGGMPEEDYGMTNNVMSYGPPRFSDAKFVLSDKDLTFEIKL